MIAHGTAQDKAKMVLDAVEHANGEAHTTKRRNGVMEVRATLSDGTAVRMEWDANGRFAYGDHSTFNGVKVRNVADAVRRIEAAKPARSKRNAKK